MQIVRLNCAFSRNLGRGDDVDGLGAIMRGIPYFLRAANSAISRAMTNIIDKKIVDKDKIDSSSEYRSRYLLTLS